MKTMKIQKPIDINCHLEYKCPNNECLYTHWLSLKECKIKNFKVVCDCGEIFKPKQIQKITIKYKQKKSSQKREPKKKKDSDFVPVDILEQCVKVLLGYGFSKSESETLIKSAYKKAHDPTVLNIIKIALSSLEIKNV